MDYLDYKMRRLLMSYVPAICNILLLGCLLGINHLYLHFLSLQLFLENLDFTSRTNLKLKTRTSLVSILFYLVMPWTSNRLSFTKTHIITFLYSKHSMMNHELSSLRRFRRFLEIEKEETFSTTPKEKTTKKKTNQKMKEM